MNAVPRLYETGHVSALLKVGARLAEAREFVASFSPELGLPANTGAAFIQRWYGNASEDVCRRLTFSFDQRFNRLPGQFEALRRILSAGEPSWWPLLNHFCLVLADPYYRWTAAEYLAPRFEKGRMEVYREDLESCLKPHLPAEFAGATVNRYARNILTALRDNGYLEGSTKKRIASPGLPAGVLAFMLYLMADAGEGANHFGESPAFRALLKPRELFVPVFREGEKAGWWEFTGDRSGLSANLRFGSLRQWLKEAFP
jgi:hypothetical protein